ncbi:MAG: 16S rRNA processing protein RimM [Oscillospiraceae bacterium]|nr:16S rRNA processing protein RimM [Oscillospiraceae bacterium]
MRVEYIPVGQIVNAHGIKGEVKLNPMGFDPEFVADFDILYIGGKRTEVKSARVHKSVVLLTLPGVNDMDAALALKGKNVTICRDDVEVPEGYYFDEEIEGMTVVDCATEAVIGKVRRVLTYPAHKIYEVKGEREYLIPAVPEVFIESVDLDSETIRVHLMKGLATDED